MTSRRSRLRCRREAAREAAHMPPIRAVARAAKTANTGRNTRSLAVYSRDVITTHRLSKLYGRGLYALRDLTITVSKGEFVFLTGPSGAGKSTLLRLLLMKERPNEGEIIVNGHNLANLSRSEIQEYRRGIGFVFQDFKLIPRRTVLENISFVSEVIGVAPALLLADEPTGNLDPDLSLEIMNLFREINAGGTTVLIATHDRELIRLVGRRSITLEQGRIVEVAEGMR